MNKEIIAYDINGYPLHENDIIYKAWYKDSPHDPRIYIILKSPYGFYYISSYLDECHYQEINEYERLPLKNRTIRKVYNIKCAKYFEYHEPTRLVTPQDEKILLRTLKRKKKPSSKIWTWFLIYKKHSFTNA